MATETIIRIQWEGPIAPENVAALNDVSHDYGIYQIYGKHDLYGDDVLVYIGLVRNDAKGKRTFAARVREHEKNWGCPSPIKSVHVGRLKDAESMAADVLAWRIQLAERLLIFRHSPAYNASNIATLFRGNTALSRELKTNIVSVRNYGIRRCLFPEASSDDYYDHETKKR